jgi:hypothetical protein
MNNIELKTTIRIAVILGYIPLHEITGWADRQIFNGRDDSFFIDLSMSGHSVNEMLHVLGQDNVPGLGDGFAKNFYLSTFNHFVLGNRRDSKRLTKIERLIVEFYDNSGVTFTDDEKERFSILRSDFFLRVDGFSPQNELSVLLSESLEGYVFHPMDSGVGADIISSIQRQLMNSLGTP